MAIYTDHLGSSISFDHPPRRIISLVPSQTELLYDLGLRDEVVGITKFCVHPEDWFKTKTKIGGTKKLKLDVIRSLAPDLLIGNKEENAQQDILALGKEFPVWMSDICDLEDGMRMIRDIGLLVNRSPEAAYLNDLIHSGFRDLEILGKTSAFYQKRILYLIWRNPYMAAASGTFIDDILRKFGLQNAAPGDRYPELNEHAIIAAAPDLIFLSSEPYPFKEAHVEALRKLVPGAKIILVDGEMFSWYGSRMVKAVQYLFELRGIVDRI